MPNLPSCFENFIGIKQACDIQGNALPTPTSGLYIQDLEGITLKASAQIANMNYINGQALLQHCIDYGIFKFFEDMRPLMSNFYRLDSIIESNTLGENDTTYLNYLNHRRGVRITKNKHNKLQFFRLNKISFLCNDTFTNVVITVKDGIYNSYTYTIDTIAGKVITIDTDLLLYSSDVTITANNDNLRVNQGRVYPQGWLNSACCGGFNYCGKEKRIYIQGIDLDANHTYSHNFGIVPEVSIECNYEGIFCAEKPNLKQILLTASGIVFLDETIASDRISQFSGFGNIDRAKERRQIWANANKTRITSFVESMTYAFNRLNDNECLTCTQLQYSQTY